MPFLVIADIEVPVSTSGASKLSPERIGSSARAFDGSLRTTVRAEKRGWRFRTPTRPNGFWTALEAAVQNGAYVSCSGDALGGTVTCEVTVGDSDLVPVPGGYRRSLSLTLREV